MSRQDSLDLLSCKLSTVPHIELLEQLCNLQIECFCLLFLIELGHLPLDLLHDREFALEKLG